MIPAQATQPQSETQSHTMGLENADPSGMPVCPMKTWLTWQGTSDSPELQIVEILKA